MRNGTQKSNLVAHRDIQNTDSIALFGKRNRNTSTSDFIRGYRHAAELLLSHAAKSEENRSDLAFPVAFLYRHHLELQLKEILRLGNALLRQSVPTPELHGLAQLWRYAKEIISEIYDSETKRKLQFVEIYVIEFLGFDADSQSFQYSTSKGRPSFIDEKAAINLSRLAETMEEVSEFLDNIIFDLKIRWSGDLKSLVTNYNLQL